MSFCISVFLFILLRVRNSSLLVPDLCLSQLFLLVLSVVFLALRVFWSRDLSLVSFRDLEGVVVSIASVMEMSGILVPSPGETFILTFSFPKWLS